MFLKPSVVLLFLLVPRFLLLSCVYCSKLLWRSISRVLFHIMLMYARLLVCFFFCFGVFLRKRRVVVSVFSRFKMFVLPLAVVFLETLGLFFFSSRSSFVYFLHVEFGVSVYIFQPRFVLLGVVSFYSSFRFRFC
jgi:hypothetical protein